MSHPKTKLELTWIGKDQRPRLEPRILLEDPSLSYHAVHRVSDTDLFDSRVIFGDNLLALKALEQEFTGKIKCIYIDPPYNTGEALEFYDDGIEHSLWLQLMRHRLEILQNLLARDGAIFVQLDDEEVAYCKVLMDEVFGRENFLNQVCIKTKHSAGASGGGEDKRLKKNVEFLLVYVKDNASSEGFQKFNDVFEEADLFDLIEDMETSGKSWKYTSVLLDTGTFVEERNVLTGSGEHINVKLFRGIKRTTINQLLRDEPRSSAHDIYPRDFGRIFSDTNAQTSIRTRIIDEFKSLAQNELLVASYIPRSGRDKGNIVHHYYISNTIRRVIWLKDSAEKRGNTIIKKEKLGTLWSGFNWNNVTKEGGVLFPKGKKPEALIQRVLELATDPGDWVLDSFGGSGTTGAVAHKMGRRFIMIELGDHIHTHILPRLHKVVDGTDQGGITPAVGWKGGGGFRYFKLAPSLLQKDTWGNWVINKDYNPAMLAEAMCKHEGFTYAPSETDYWNHGYSTESDFLYVTTQTLTQAQLEYLSEKVGEERTLLICCLAWRGSEDAFPNLTLKKIPNAVKNQCEWGRDDYSLQIANLPAAPETSLPTSLRSPQKGGLGKKRAAETGPTLFDGAGEEKTR